jgi:tetratricopeptide (TPR) repeat protein
MVIHSGGVGYRRVLMLFSSVHWRRSGFAAFACIFGLLAGAQSEPQDRYAGEIAAGNTALAHGQWAVAERAFRNAVASRANSGPVYRGLAISLLRQNRLFEAAAVLERGLQADPALPGGHFLLGLARFGTGDLKAAIISLSEATARNPNDRQALLYLARAHFLLGERSQCLAVLNHLLLSAPDDAEGLLLLAQADPAQAGPVGRRLMRLAPDSYEIWQWQADDFESKGQLAEAVRAYSKAIEKAPALAGVNFGLARVYVRMADYESARDALRRELALNPFSSSASLLLGSLEVLDGRFEEAISDLKRASQSPSTAADAYLNLGRAYLKLGDALAARDALEKAVALQPKLKGAYYQLALAYSRLGKKAEAEENLAEFHRLRAENSNQ